jgi:hypothetical protein
VREPHVRAAPSYGAIKRKLIRGGIAVAVLIAVVIGVIALLPGLKGVRSAIGRPTTEGALLHGSGDGGVRREHHH